MKVFLNGQLQETRPDELDTEKSELPGSISFGIEKLLDAEKKGNTLERVS